MWMGFVLTGFLAGTISGMGIGGGAILIPALGIFFGMGQKSAQSINLLYFIPTAAVAVITHRRKGNIQSGVLPKLLFYGLIGAATGATLAMWIDADMLRKIFGFFLLVMGVIEIFKKVREEESNMEQTTQTAMELTAFENMKERFRNADVDDKIDMYIEAEGLSHIQYKELLRMFPLNELDRLEKALA